MAFKKNPNRAARRALEQSVTFALEGLERRQFFTVSAPTGIIGTPSTTSSITLGHLNGAAAAAAIAPPYAPYYLSTVANSATQISLNWYDNAGVETGVHIERKSGNGAFGVVATLAPHAQSYVDILLTAGTTYTYRVASFNSSGNSPYTNESAAATAGTTPVTPPVVPPVTPPAANPPFAPYYLSATADSASQVSLKWYDNAGVETGVNVERQMGNGAWSVIATLAPHAQSYADTTVSGSTLYSYRVASINSAGPSPYTNVSSAQTPAGTTPVTPPVIPPVTPPVIPPVTPIDPAVNPPYAPYYLSANADSASQISLKWYDNFGVETGVHIERQTGTGPWTLVATLAPHAQSYADTTVTGSTSYSYRVASFNAGGNSPYTNISSAQTPASGTPVTPPPAVPSAPTSLAAVAGSSSQITLTWTDTSNNETGFNIERQNGATWPVLTSVAANTTTYTDTGLTASTAYTYRVVATSAAGPSDYSNTSTATTPAAVVATQPPAAPFFLSAAANASGNVVINWFDGIGIETGVKVQRQLGNGAWSVIATLAPHATTYTDTTAAGSSFYSYNVFSLNSAGPSPVSNQSSVITPASTTAPTIPGAPTALSSAALSDTQIQLNWTSNSTNESGFYVEKYQGTVWLPAATLPAGATNWIDSGLTAGTPYTYRVDSFNTAGASAPSNTSTATTLTGAPAVPNSPSNLVVSPFSTTQIALQWNDNSVNETGFAIQKLVNGGWSPVTTTAANATSFTDSGLTPGTAYTYRVFSVNNIGPSAASAGPSTTSTQAVVTAPTTPAAPTNLVAATVSNTQLSLSWTDNSNNETGFNIERLNGATWSVIATTLPNSTGYTDNGLTASTAYSYRVSAVNGNLVSGYTNLATGTTAAGTINQPRTDLSTFFPIGVFLQPAYLMSTWQSRGINTMVGHEKYGTTTLESWTATANSLGLKYIREPLASPALDISDPNLLAWLYPVDEPDLEPDVNVASAPAAAEYQRLKAIDPTRPVATTYAGGTLVGLLGGRPKSYYDQLITNNTDWILSAMYPVSGWNLPNQLNLVGQTLDRAKQWYPGKREIAYIETSNQNLPWVGAAERGPTASEMRGEIWDAIIHGSTGIVYFPQEVFNPFQYDNTPADVVNEMVAQNARLSKFGTALLTAENPGGTSLSGSGNIETCWRRYNGHTYYFALNLSPNAVSNVSLASTGLGSSQTLSVDGENRAVTLQNGNLVDSFGANECHVYVV